MGVTNFAKLRNALTRTGLPHELLKNVVGRARVQEHRCGL